VSRYSIKKICLALLLSSNLFANSSDISQDELIIRGIFYEEHYMYNSAYAIYDELYTQDKIDAFLFKMAKASMLSGNHVKSTIKLLEQWEKKHKGKLKAKRFLVSLYMQVDDISKAKKISKELLELSSNPVDYELVSNIYAYNGEYKKALKLLNKAYDKQHKESTLLLIVSIMQDYTKEYKKAIQLLEMHRRINLIVSNSLYKKLIELYVKTNDIDGVLQTYKALYKQDPKDIYLSKIVDAYIYKADFDGAIKFFEENKPDDEILFDLYRHQKLYHKALKFATKKYEQTQDASWLAKRAIVRFEGAKNKQDKSMLKNVMKDFDDAIKNGVDDSSYYNYYGYLLIDNNKDVKKGIELITKALNQQPNNAYYIDSLAWGYYKIHQCKKAYKLMKDIPTQEIEDTIELKEHFDIIQKCK